MSRSIFDPTGDPERTGSTYTSPEADQFSQMPPDVANPRPSVVTGQVDFQPPPPIPAVQVFRENEGSLLIIRITGKLHEGDYKHFVPIVDQAIQQHGKIRMLVEMHNFRGWDAGALWEDFKFDVKHFNKIERIAIVGEKSWERWMAAFCKPFTTAAIRFFPAEQSAKAQAWLEQN